MIDTLTDITIRLGPVIAIGIACLIAQHVAERGKEDCGDGSKFLHGAGGGEFFNHRREKY